MGRILPRSENRGSSLERGEAALNPWWRRDPNPKDQTQDFLVLRGLDYVASIHPSRSRPTASTGQATWHLPYVALHDPRFGVSLHCAHADPFHNLIGCSHTLNSEVLFGHGGRLILRRYLCKGMSKMWQDKINFKQQHNEFYTDSDFLESKNPTSSLPLLMCIFCY
jgi:hypothetical protein